MTAEETGTSMAEEFAGLTNPPKLARAITQAINDAVEEEREACAKICDNRGQFADNCAAAIRGRKDAGA